jgi:hypothetical protein
VRIPSLGAMHHYLGLFYGRHPASNSFVSPFIPDEYALFAKSNGFSVNVTSAIDHVPFLFNRVPWEEPVPPYVR